MKKLLGIRTVYDIDPTKPFRVADVIEDGATLPHSVNIGDPFLTDLENGIGDESDDLADYRERNDLYTMGMGG